MENNGQSVPVGRKSSRMSSAVECMMHSWLEAWRSLNRDCLQISTTAWRFKKLIFLAAKQIYCYEMILQERKIVNDSFIKCITTAEQISSKRSTRQSRLNNENQRMFRQLLCLKAELSDRQKALVKTKLELHCLRQRLRQQASKTSRMASRLEENKLLTEKLLERNVKLSERTRELLELYRTRALMFVYKLIGMAQELLVAKTRSKAFADASAHLKSKNKKLQQRQRILVNKLTTLVSQHKAQKDAPNGNHGLLHMVFHYMGCLWECVSSLGQCPRLEGPNRRCQWALLVI